MQVQFPQRRASEATAFRPVFADVTPPSNIMDLTPPLVTTPAAETGDSPVSGKKVPNLARFNSKENQSFNSKENQPCKHGGDFAIQESAVSDLVARSVGIMSGKENNTLSQLPQRQASKDSMLLPEQRWRSSSATPMPLAVAVDDPMSATPMANFFNKTTTTECPESPVKSWPHSVRSGHEEDDDVEGPDLIFRSRDRAASKESVTSMLNCRRLSFQSNDPEMMRQFSPEMSSKDPEAFRRYTSPTAVGGRAASRASGDSCDGGDDTQSDYADDYGLTTPHAAAGRSTPGDAWSTSSTQKANMAWTEPGAPCGKSDKGRAHEDTTSQVSNESSASRMSMLVVRRLFSAGGDGLSSSGSAGSTRPSWFSRFASRVTWR